MLVSKEELVFLSVDATAGFPRGAWQTACQLPLQAPRQHHLPQASLPSGIPGCSPGFLSLLNLISFKVQNFIFFAPYLVFTEESEDNHSKRCPKGPLEEDNILVFIVQVDIIEVYQTGACLPAPM